MSGPLVVQSDKTVLLEVDHPDAPAARTAIAPFAELERSPEHVHTYRITPLALWNARSAGHDAEQAVDALVRFSRYPVPPALLVDVADTMGRYGRLVIEDRPGGGLVLRAATVDDVAVLAEVRRHRHVAPLLGAIVSDIGVAVDAAERGRLKQALLRAGWPAVDAASYATGDPFPVDLDFTGDGVPWSLRDYQVHAVEGFAAGGSGVIVLPCGSGKTIVGAAALARLSTNALILATSTVSARQWRRELLARTTLTDDDIGEYSGDRKEIRPVTVATYQVLVTRRGGRYTHLDLFSAREWGLVIYDEVHLLPAPVFRMTSEIQTRRRLGLTATLVREDGREGDVFSLIGPKRFDTPWRDLESQGWIAPARCTEVRVALTADERMAYATADADVRYRVGATATSKLPVVEALVARHRGEPTLVIGAYLDQLDEIASRLGAPTVTGETPVAERERLYDAFRTGTERLLVVSKVANFSIDLPDAAVAVQVSGTFGSRQEEAQRLGRILRPKTGGGQAHFYTVVSRDTNDADYAAHRQRFLAEQGYTYSIVDSTDLLTTGEVDHDTADG
jgi:DNA excision repair protein ERCC-3